MSMYWIEVLAQRLSDLWFALRPQPRPSRDCAERCGIVAHRGEHDRRERRENTLAAFEAARAGGVWAIELDLRWTLDYEPVVLHDPDTRRVFGVDLSVAEVDFAELRARVPEVPSLAEVIAEFGSNTHLMMELKPDPLPDVERKRARLRTLLGSLAPATDYHVLALAPELFAPMDFAGESACIAVAELNVAEISRTALEHDYAGVAGQYLLFGRELIERHRARGQRVGTGFVASRFCLYREMNRGIDWVYSNRACRLAAIRRKLLE